MPEYVEREFRSYLKCGIHAFGFARAFCDHCKHDFIISFSCKKRGVCPSCGQRHMVETAAHLVDNVMPRAPVRQWVLSFPKRVRYFLHNDPKVAGDVLRIFLRAVETMLRKRSPGAPRKSRTGSVTFVQRFGSTINAHTHFHANIIDGVFAPGENEEAVFF